MLSVEEAKTAILAEAQVLAGIEEVPLFECLGRVLAEDIYSLVDVPRADNSAMDGVVVACSDCKDEENNLPISQRIAAGQNTKPLKPETAARIFTGAEIPKGGNAVIIQEDCHFIDDRVYFRGKPKLGANIRKQGQDIQKGALILAKGTRLRPQELSLIASIGLSQISVFKKLKVGVFSTGNELVDPGQKLLKGQIYNSNPFGLAGLVLESDCEFINLGKVQDSLEQTIDLLKKAAKKVDIIISSGGVSVGEEDHVKPAIEACGTLSLWKIAVKPGKPLALGKVGSTPFFGLPGNPVSSFITFLIFVKPFLEKASGVTLTPTNWLSVKSSFQRSAPSREEYLRVRVQNGIAELYNNQGSGVLSSVSWSTGIIRQKIGVEIHDNSVIEYLPYELF